jgi:hypothetical protein
MCAAVSATRALVPLGLASAPGKPPRRTVRGINTQPGGEMKIEIDRVALQALVGCGVTLEAGPSRVTPLQQQLMLVANWPQAGRPFRGEPGMTDCRVMVGDPHVAYRIGDRIELLAVQRGALGSAITAAISGRRTASAQRSRALRFKFARSAAFGEPLGSTQPLSDVQALKLARAIESRGSKLNDRSGGPEWFRFPWNGLQALWVGIPYLKLGVAIGAGDAGDADQTAALEDLARQELGAIRDVVGLYAPSALKHLEPSATGAECNPPSDRLG